MGHRVRLYPDGKYRWVYEVSMLKNPSILADTFRVLGLSIGVVWLFMIVITAFDGTLGLESLWLLTRPFLLIMLLAMVLGIVAYLIVAWSYGWKYVVLFTMDEKKIVHQQMSRQVKKAQVLGALTALAGAAAGRAGAAGAGILSASRFSSTSVFADVRRITPCRKQNLIKVNQLLNKNRIYVCDEDFDFVYDFIRQAKP